MAAAMDHLVDGPDGTVDGGGDRGRPRARDRHHELQPGETLRIVKFLAYGWSSQRSAPSLRDQADAASPRRGARGGTG